MLAMHRFDVGLAWYSTTACALSRHRFFIGIDLGTPAQHVQGQLASGCMQKPDASFAKQTLQLVAMLLHLLGGSEGPVTVGTGSQSSKY